MPDWVRTKSTLWELGLQRGRRVFHIVARVEQKQDGSYAWWTPNESGITWIRDTALTLASAAAPAIEHVWMAHSVRAGVYHCAICGEEQSRGTPDADRLLRSLFGEA